MFSLVGMAFSTVLALSAFTMNPFFGVLLLANSVGSFIFFRDLYVLFKNTTEFKAPDNLWKTASENLKGTILPIWEPLALGLLTLSVKNS